MYPRSRSLHITKGFNHLVLCKGFIFLLGNHSFFNAAILEKKVSVNFFEKVRNVIKAENNSYYPVCWHTLKQMCCGRVKLLSFLKHPVTAHSLVCAECFL